MKIQNKKVVLIHGKKRSGKDYFQKFLQRELENENIKADIHSFQDSIKEILSITFNLSVNEIENLKNYNDPIQIGSSKNCTTMRNIIQRFGTDQMQLYFGKDVWVNLFKRIVSESEADVILVPDFRFTHEEISNFTVKILGGLDDTHISENDLKNFDFKYIIDNTEKMDLSKEVEFIVNEIKNSLEILEKVNEEIRDNLLDNEILEHRFMDNV